MSVSPQRPPPPLLDDVCAAASLIRKCLVVERVEKKFNIIMETGSGWGALREIKSVVSVYKKVCVFYMNMWMFQLPFIMK